MNRLKSSSVLKGEARELLLGKYQTVVFAYVLMDLIISGCLTFIEMSVNLQAVSGVLIYFTAYFIILLISAVFMAGQNRMYLNICRENSFGSSDIWSGFRTCADKAIFIYLRILLKSFAYTIPCILSAGVMIASKNYYFSILVAFTAIFMMLGITLVNLDYSQALYLIWDYPEESTAQLLKRSKNLMKGHRGSYFYLIVSFLGMGCLILMTFGLGTFWVYPYFTTTKTRYYLELTSFEPKHE